ncbi:hypothetical protein MMC21_008218 [Puttea exsequens]|nr:hypothetical protein [Puttea exsequens]
MKACQFFSFAFIDFCHHHHKSQHKEMIEVGRYTLITGGATLDLAEVKWATRSPLTYTSTVTENPTATIYEEKVTSVWHEYETYTDIGPKIWSEVTGTGTGWIEKNVLTAVPAHIKRAESGETFKLVTIRVPSTLPAPIIFEIPYDAGTTAIPSGESILP